MICPNCSSENRPGAKFCDECGTRLPIDFQIDSVEEAFGTAEELNSRFGELPEIPYEPQEAGEEAEEPLVSAEVPAEEGGEVEMEAEDAPVEEEPGMGDATGIENVETAPVQNGRIYNVLGQEVKTAKGLVIKNGKKFINK